MLGTNVIFDWHISIGTVIEICSILIGGLFFMWSMKSRVDLMSNEVSNLKIDIRKLADIFTKMAVYDQRFLNMERTVDEMRHGIGFITKPPFN